MVFSLLSRRKKIKRSQTTIGRIFFLSGLVGVCAGLGALLFATLLALGKHFFLEVCMGYVPTVAYGELQILGIQTDYFLPWLILLLPVVGGLLSGILVEKFAPRAAGAGNNATIYAYHHDNDAVNAKTSFIKILASTLTLSTGGSGGQEGPMVQIGSGFGSSLAKYLHLNRAERRMLIAAGISGGVAAIFGAPLAAALFAAEVFYSSLDFEYEVIPGAVISAIVAHGIFAVIFDHSTLFTIPTVEFSNHLELIPYTFLAILVAVGAIVFIQIFFLMKNLFEKIKVPNYIKPAIGGFMVGIVGLGAFALLGFQNGIDYGVIGTGYGFLQNILLGKIGLAFLTLVAFGKMFTTSFSVASRGSAGLFGPAIVIGGAFGGMMGIILQSLFPSLELSMTAFVLVGMSGFFSAVANTPISTIIMVSEITGNFELLIPVMWVSFLAYLIARRYHLFEHQLESRFDSPVHRSEIMSIAENMKK